MLKTTIFFNFTRVITQDTIRKIIDTAQALDVVADFVTLKKSGSIYKGNCPFHQERTPSFVVNPNKNIFKCFGCGKGGDAIGFIMEYEKLSYPEALRYLAQKYNIEVEETHTQSEESKEEQSQIESLYIALNFAAKFYQQQLTESEDGRNIALSYCKERGFSNETITTFQIGYSPDSFDAFYKEAKSNAFNEDILLKAGLIKEKNEKRYDFFRDRLMFPIWNVSGKVIAFGGRILKKIDNQPKYINTAETDVYHKSQILYGIFQAKSDIRKNDACFLVEGYTDVISLHQSGIKNVVASSGTALTKEQVFLIKRFTENIIILYDGDAAGIKAALRGLDIVLELGLNVKIVLLPDGEDPDSFVKQKGKEEALQFIKENQQDFILFKASQSISDVKNDPIQKAEAIKDIVRSITLIQDNIKRQLYIKECATIVDIDEKTLINEVNKIKIQQIKKRENVPEEDVEQLASLQEKYIEPQKKESQIPEFFYQERDIIRVLLEHADKSMNEEDNVGAYILSELVEVPFKNTIFDKIIKHYINAYEQDIPFDTISDATKIEDNQIKLAIIDIQSSKYEISENWLKKHEIIITEANRTYKTDVASVLNRYKYLKFMELLKDLDEKIKLADTENKMEELYSSLQKKIKLIGVRNELAKEIGTVTHPY
ncbi:MAG TPA: DNA primase [Chitinophagales bacterium]|nr:DNA primase [Chitinophagales bacterium]HMW94225.1 DNA primase [Chitinophagales bacterium]HMY43329.1 DNA primase [Chitinophagales bacterium]HNC64536.1 DNA primase [Chitinophagales bacterium]HNG27660.1 DNA primase [Chitinophagales bacterium]